MPPFREAAPGPAIPASSLGPQTRDPAPARAGPAIAGNERRRAGAARRGAAPAGAHPGTAPDRVRKRWSAASRGASGPSCGPGGRCRVRRARTAPLARTFRRRRGRPPGGPVAPRRGSPGRIRGGCGPRPPPPEPPGRPPGPGPACSPPVGESRPFAGGRRRVLILPPPHREDQDSGRPPRGGPAPPGAGRAPGTARRTTRRRAGGQRHRIAASAPARAPGSVDRQATKPSGRTRIASPGARSWASAAVSEARSTPSRYTSTGSGRSLAALAQASPSGPVSRTKREPYRSRVEIRLPPRSTGTCGARVPTWPRSSRGSSGVVSPSSSPPSTAAERYR